MKTRSIFILAYFLLIVNSLGQVSTERQFDPLLSSEVLSESREKVSLELNKAVAIVRFVKVDNPRIEQEIEMWNKFLEGVDRELVGFLYVLDQKSDGFMSLWRKKMPLDIPVIWDQKGTIKDKNEVSEAYDKQTLLLGIDLKILTETGSPILLDNFDFMRSVLGHELKRMGYTSGVKGAITDPIQGNPTWLMGQPVYMTQDGEILSNDEFVKLLGSKQYYPSFTLSDTVILIKRN
ncbi:hypothetical protein [Algoriphagus namhaensis]